MKDLEITENDVLNLVHFLTHTIDAYLYQINRLEALLCFFVYISIEPKSTTILKAKILLNGATCSPLKFASFPRSKSVRTQDKKG